MASLRNLSTKLKPPRHHLLRAFSVPVLTGCLSFFLGNFFREWLGGPLSKHFLFEYTGGCHENMPLSPITWLFCHLTNQSPCFHVATSDH